jgi:Flp pilus assembly protein TadG
MTAHSALRPLHGIRNLRAALRDWRQTELGQTLVEFSMVLPLFLILLFALVDFGRGFFTWLTITNAAREGARAAAVQSDSGTVDSKIHDAYCSSYPGDCSLDTSLMTVVKTNVGGARGSETSVDITYAFEYVTPIGALLGLLGGHLDTPTITAHSSMRLE